MAESKLKRFVKKIKCPMKQKKIVHVLHFQGVIGQVGMKSGLNFEELEADIKKAFTPKETLFVVDAMLGQIAIETIQSFNEKVAFDGVNSN